MSTTIKLDNIEVGTGDGTSASIKLQDLANSPNLMSYNTNVSIGDCTDHHDCTQENNKSCCVNYSLSTDANGNIDFSISNPTFSSGTYSFDIKFKNLIDYPLVGDATTCSGSSGCVKMSSLLIVVNNGSTVECIIPGSEVTTSGITNDAGGLNPGKTEKVSSITFKTSTTIYPLIVSVVANDSLIVSGNANADINGTYTVCGNYMASGEVGEYKKLSDNPGTKDKPVASYQMYLGAVKGKKFVQMYLNKCDGDGKCNTTQLVLGAAYGVSPFGADGWGANEDAYKSTMYLPSATWAKNGPTWEFQTLIKPALESSLCLFDYPAIYDKVDIPKTTITKKDSTNFLVHITFSANVGSTSNIVSAQSSVLPWVDQGNYLSVVAITDTTVLQPPDSGTETNVSKACVITKTSDSQVTLASPFSSEIKDSEIYCFSVGSVVAKFAFFTDTTTNNGTPSTPSWQVLTKYNYTDAGYVQLSTKLPIKTWDNSTWGNSRYVIIRKTTDYISTSMYNFKEWITSDKSYSYYTTAADTKSTSYLTPFTHYIDPATNKITVLPIDWYYGKDIKVLDKTKTPGAKVDFTTDTNFMLVCPYEATHL
jgi:hypothetical protein